MEPFKAPPIDTGLDPQLPPPPPSLDEEPEPAGESNPAATLQQGVLPPRHRRRRPHTTQTTLPHTEKKRRGGQRRQRGDEKEEEFVVDIEEDTPSFAHLEGKDDDGSLQKKRKKRSKHPDKLICFECMKPISIHEACLSCDECQEVFHVGCSKLPDQYVPVGDTCYRFMCANCGMGVPFFEFREKIWPYVMLLTLFNLMVHPVIGMNMQRRFFNIHEIFSMMDQYWDALCTGRQRTKTWWRTANAVLSTRHDLFLPSSTFSDVRSYYTLRDPHAHFGAFLPKEVEIPSEKDLKVPIEYENYSMIEFVKCIASVTGRTPLEYPPPPGRERKPKKTKRPEESARKRRKTQDSSVKGTSDKRPSGKGLRQPVWEKRRLKTAKDVMRFPAGSGRLGIDFNDEQEEEEKSMDKLSDDDELMTEVGKPSKMEEEKDVGSLGMMSDWSGSPTPRDNEDGENSNGEKDENDGNHDDEQSLSDGSEISPFEWGYPSSMRDQIDWEIYGENGQNTFSNDYREKDGRDISEDENVFSHSILTSVSDRIHDEQYGEFHSGDIQVLGSNANGDLEEERKKPCMRDFDCVILHKMAKEKRFCVVLGDLVRYEGKLGVVTRLFANENGISFCEFDRLIPTGSRCLLWSTEHLIAPVAEVRLSLTPVVFGKDGIQSIHRNRFRARAPRKLGNTLFITSRSLKDGRTLPVSCSDRKEYEIYEIRRLLKLVAEADVGYCFVESEDKSWSDFQPLAPGDGVHVDVLGIRVCQMHHSTLRSKTT
eukprot:TRINITY_DN70682_c0_g1_i1.p1 TRINITY_DN70682_c0_g1~~TRINITY_DN70682_c0_g1_i1.p1  ORF type:complete len:764 (-),score=217.62 TRINITY_DN70682_c0_g1_i1:61-2352(-)